MARTGVRIQSCEILDVSRIGVALFASGVGARISNSRFESGGLVFQGQTDALVSGCTFVRVGGNAQQYSDVTLEDCTFLEGASFGAAESTLRLESNWFSSDLDASFDIDASSESLILGTGNRFGGGADAALLFLSGTAAILHGNHILRTGGGEIVLARNYSSNAPATVDLRENWWGTTDSLLIEGLIERTGASEADLQILWKPYLDAPVPTRQEHVGSLKARY